MSKTSPQILSLIKTLFCITYSLFPFVYLCPSIWYCSLLRWFFSGQEMDIVELPYIVKFTCPKDFPSSLARCVFRKLCSPNACCCEACCSELFRGALAWVQVPNGAARQHFWLYLSRLSWLFPVDAFSLSKPELSFGFTSFEAWCNENKCYKWEKAESCRVLMNPHIEQLETSLDFRCFCIMIVGGVYHEILYLLTEGIWNFYMGCLS